MDTNNNKIFTTSNVLTILALIFLGGGSFIVFLVLTMNLQNSFVDFRSFLIGVEMQLIGIVLLIIKRNTT